MTKVDVVTHWSSRVTLRCHPSHSRLVSSVTSVSRPAVSLFFIERSFAFIVVQAASHLASHSDAFALQQRDAEDGGDDVEAALAVADAGVAILHLVLGSRTVAGAAIDRSELVLGLVVLRFSGPRRRLLADQRRVRTSVSGNARNLKDEVEL